MSEHLPPGRVNALVEHCVAGLDLDVDLVELRGSGPKRVLRVVVDRDGGVPIDVISQASRELSRELDRSQVMGETAYTLEVTSRGVDRPLTRPRHWARNVGRLVVAVDADGARVRGRIVSASDTVVNLEGGTCLRLSDIATAHIEPELNRPRTAPERNG